MSSPVNHHSQSRSPSPHASGHHSHHSSPHRGSDKPMKWINPCRIPKSMPTQPAEIQMPMQTDEEIFQNIVIQAKKAEVQARQFFEDFVSCNSFYAFYFSPLLHFLFPNKHHHQYNFNFLFRSQLNGNTNAQKTRVNWFHCMLMLVSKSLRIGCPRKQNWARFCSTKTRTL